MQVRNAPELNQRIVEYVADGVARFPDRLILFVRLTPRLGGEALKVLDRAVKTFSFKAVKLHPESYNLIPMGDATVNILKRAADYGIPVLIHCTDEVMCLPIQAEMVLERSPDTVVMLVHVDGFFHTEERRMSPTCANASPTLISTRARFPMRRS